MSPQYIYVLFGGTSKNRKRLVDVYFRENGRYKGSFLLPAPAIEFQYYDGGFYVLQENPFPEIQFIRPVGSALR